MQLQRCLALVYVLLLTSPTFILAQAVNVSNGDFSSLLDDPAVKERDKRYAFAIPWALRGIAAAPALYRWLVAWFGASAVTSAGITLVQQGGKEKGEKRQAARFGSQMYTESF